MLGYIIRRLGVAVIVVIGVAADHVRDPALPLADAGLRGARQKASRERGRAPGTSSTATTALRSPSSSATWAISLHCNFGYSYKLNQSVDVAVQGERRPQRLSLRRCARAVADHRGAARDPQAVKRNSPGDYAATAVNFTLYSMPSFFLGLILIQIFALDSGIFPVGVSDNDHDHLAGDHPPEPAVPADRHADAAQRRQLQPLHALLGARRAGPGLHPPGAGQGPVREGGAVRATCCATPACR